MLTENRTPDKRHSAILLREIRAGSHCRSDEVVYTPKTFSLTSRNKSVYCSFIFTKREIVMIGTARISL